MGAEILLIFDPCEGIPQEIQEAADCHEREDPSKQVRIIALNRSRRGVIIPSERTLHFEKKGYMYTVTNCPPFAPMLFRETPEKCIDRVIHINPHDPSQEISFRRDIHNREELPHISLKYYSESIEEDTISSETLVTS